MKTNYAKMARYAEGFIGKDFALDLVHEAWLKKKEQGIDVFEEDKPNRYLYLLVKSEFFNTIRSGTGKMLKNCKQIESLDYEPPVYSGYSNLDNLIRRDLRQWVLRKRESMNLLANHYQKYYPEMIFDIYDLVQKQYTGREIANELGCTSNKTVVEFLKIIKEISKKYKDS